MRLLPKDREKSQIVVVGHSSPALNSGLSFRPSRSGPELELVEDFLEQWPIRLRSGHVATVFREPRIETGFPDLVIVIWSTKVASGWSQSRSLLKKDDFRVVHYVFQRGVCLEQRLHAAFGPSVLSSLERLVAAGMIRKSGDTSWRVRSFSKIFAARHIIAIEAKFTRKTAALRQAALNTWFCSASFVLFPSGRIPGGLSWLAESYGVGLLRCDEEHISPKYPGREDLPRSYMSWAFNDFAWRSASAQVHAS